MMTRVLTMLLAGLLALPLAAEAQKTIKVGMPMPLSGPPALFGEPASKGAQMFVDEINAKGGVLGGRKLELIVRDSKADANEAVRVAASSSSRTTWTSWWPPDLRGRAGGLGGGEGEQDRLHRAHSEAPISSPPPTSCTRTCSAFRQHHHGGPERGGGSWPMAGDGVAT